MRIVFSLYNVGLGNNGGSRTLLRCAETIAKLGYESIVYGSSLRGYTWHKPAGIKFVGGNNFPDCDIAIATGYHSVDSVVRCNAKRKLYYIRGFERWVVNEQKLLESYKKLECIVNSEWLQAKLSSMGVESTLIYPGLDNEWFYNRDLARSGVGAIYHTKHATKRHTDAEEVAKITKLPFKFLNRDVVNANPEIMNNYYNSVYVWFAPTELEGLHNPPIEASLAGCALVCNDHQMNGMNDYAKHKQTALVYPTRDLGKAAEYIKKLIGDPTLRMRLNLNMIDMLNSKIGSRANNMQKLVNTFS